MAWEQGLVKLLPLASWITIMSHDQPPALLHELLKYDLGFGHPLWIHTHRVVELHRPPAVDTPVLTVHSCRRELHTPVRGDTVEPVLVTVALAFERLFGPVAELYSGVIRNPILGLLQLLHDAGPDSDEIILDYLTRTAHGVISGQSLLKVIGRVRVCYLCL